MPNQTLIPVATIPVATPNRTVYASNSMVVADQPQLQQQQQPTFFLVPDSQLQRRQEQKKGNPFIDAVKFLGTLALGGIASLGIASFILVRGGGHLIRKLGSSLHSDFHGGLDKVFEKIKNEDTRKHIVTIHDSLLGENGNLKDLPFKWLHSFIGKHEVVRKPIEELQKKFNEERALLGSSTGGLHNKGEVRERTAAMEKVQQVVEHLTGIKPIAPPNNRTSD